MNSDELSGNQADFVDNNNFKLTRSVTVSTCMWRLAWTNTVNLSRIGMQPIILKSQGLLSISPGIILPIPSTGH